VRDPVAREGEREHRHSDAILRSDQAGLAVDRVLQQPHAAGCPAGDARDVARDLLAAWREAKVFTEAERAALQLAEQGTRIADAAGGVTDDAWANAAKHYDDDQLIALVGVIALINAYNRMNVIIQQPAGDYQPGQFG